jgi:hypothetical protein
MPRDLRGYALAAARLVGGLGAAREDEDEKEEWER